MQSNDDADEDERFYVNDADVRLVKLFVPSSTPAELCSIGFQASSQWFATGDPICLIAAVVADDYGGGQAAFIRLCTTVSTVDAYQTVTLPSEAVLEAGTDQAFLVGVELCYQGYGVDTSTSPSAEFVAYGNNDMTDAESDFDLGGTLLIRAGISSGASSPAARSINADRGSIYHQASTVITFDSGGAGVQQLLPASTESMTGIAGISSVDLEEEAAGSGQSFTIQVRPELSTSADLGIVRYTAVFKDGSTAIADLKVIRARAEVVHDLPAVVGDGTSGFDRVGMALDITMSYHTSARNGMQAFQDLTLSAENTTNSSSDSDTANTTTGEAVLTIEVEEGENTIELTASAPGFPDATVEVEIDVADPSHREDLVLLEADLRVIANTPNHTYAEEAEDAADQILVALAEEALADLLEALEEALPYLAFDEDFESRLAAAAVGLAGGFIDGHPGLTSSSDPITLLAAAESHLDLDEHEEAMDDATCAVVAVAELQSLISRVSVVNHGGVVSVHAPLSLEQVWQRAPTLAFEERPTGALGLGPAFLAVGTTQRIWILKPWNAEQMTSLDVEAVAVLSQMDDLLAAGGAEGLEVWDLSDPQDPIERGAFQEPEDFEIYLLHVHDELTIFYSGLADATVRRATRSSSTTDFEADEDLAELEDMVTAYGSIAGNLIVGEGDGDLRILDSGDGTLIEGPFTAESGIVSIGVHENIVLATTEEDGLLVLDEELELVDTMALPQGEVHLRILGQIDDRAWVAGSRNLYLIDLTQSPPEILHTLDAGHPLHGVGMMR